MATSALRAELHQINQQIDLQRRVLYDLEVSRFAVQSKLSQLAVYPILTLPPELTSEIFVHCLPEDSWADIYEAPLLLTRVCRTWAHIAASTPALWRSLRLCLGEWDDQELRELLETWFRPNRGSALKIVLGGDLARVDLPEFMTSLQRHAHHISSLSLTLTARNLALLKSFPLKMRFLRELEITVEDEEDEIYAEPVDLKDVFVDTSQLTQVHVDQILPANITLPWQQLTDFQCYDYFLDEVLEVLRLIPNLVSLDVTLGLEDHRDPARDKLIHHNLQRLTVMEQERLDRQETLHLLHFLTLPKLDTLKTEELEERTLRAFMRRSDIPPLATMHVNLVGFPHECLDVCQEILPSLRWLEDLSLSCPTLPFAQAFFSGLAARETFLPRLRKLAIGYDELTLANQATLTSVLELVAQAALNRNVLAQAGVVHCLDFLSFVVKLTELASLRLPFASLSGYRQLQINGVEVYIGTSLDSLL
ncbi:hypothetical protein MIND_00823600 [Mycena indigotica]|uniref:F-box domain-containing protein n=1 Tax=Mycena indigotica TaxID=2126181 RepID=A0A8H6SFW0_9AGAR|nr:uncharacterized protein MIND_00823600 [Mycena indigotica]KAF7298761.1 hypothetical protein MIND_00823600 [Mycena indigotica]